MRQENPLHSRNTLSLHTPMPSLARRLAFARASLGGSAILARLLGVLDGLDGLDGLGVLGVLDGLSRRPDSRQSNDFLNSIDLSPYIYRLK